MTQQRSLESVACHFDIAARPISMAPYGNGHINDTFLAQYERAGERVSYIHQRISQRVFPRIDLLMENIARVTGHAAASLRRGGARDVERRTLTIVPARQGGSHALIDGEAWRTYLFVDRALTYEFPETPELAYQASSAFGRFVLSLADLDATELHETIAGFHHTPTRYARMCESARADLHGRAGSVSEELDFAHQRAGLMARLTDALASGDLPLRITHNDTKLNNVLIDEASHEGVCVVDLDTVMPGSLLYDFGDMVRTITSATPEDETRLERVFVRPSFYEALARGYSEAMGALLTPLERELFPFAGQLITLEIGMRFLTDYLDGDIYFKTKRPHHNRDRCRAQFRLVETIEERFDELRKLTPSG
ncbi:MAG: aminoglycoside phosphotransferase family protein [Proteobacteria bacterium]|nr:aminoglycoside phosphotransferase family protein [Pseudomonadota bacterium]